jgi:hypothetical protein
MMGERLKVARKKSTGTFLLGDIQYGDKPLEFDSITLRCIQEAMDKVLDENALSSAANTTRVKIDKTPNDYNEG